MAPVWVVWTFFLLGAFAGLVQATRPAPQPVAQRPLTPLDQLRDRFIAGAIDADELEREVGTLLEREMR